MTTGQHVRSRPRLLFAAVSLQAGAGGIAELSRQVVRALVELHRQERIQLEIRVLEGSGLSADDALLGSVAGIRMRWYAGRRWRFALGLVCARCDMQLLDHLGLARVPSLIPLSAVRNYMVLIHGVELLGRRRADYLRAARRARLLIANSEYTRCRVRERFPDLPRIEVCWPGKDPGGASRPRAQDFPCPIGPHAMLIVGRMSSEQRHKGHDQLIQALPSILRSVPDAQLVIAGAGDDQARLEAMVERHKLQAHTVFTGWVEESRLGDLYTQCALFVMPSQGDGFGLVFLEAMMHRLPCVGLEESAAAEIFGEECSGVLVDREHLEAMADILAELLQDEERRKRLGEAGYERYQKHFRAPHFARKLQAIVVGCLTGEPAILGKGSQAAHSGGPSAT